RQRLAGFEGGLARSLQDPRFADGDADTLSGLLPGGEEVFSTLSAALWRDYQNRSSAVPGLGTAYVKSVSSDAKGGFHVTFVIDGNESLAHFPAHRFGTTLFQGGVQGSLTGYSLWSWTDSFEAGSDETEAANRTGGASYYDYFDVNGWQAGTSGIGNFRGIMAYGVRTRPDNLPTGSAGYEGRLRAEMWNADGSAWGSQNWVRGTVHLQANFDDGQVSGRIDGLQFQPQGESRYALPDGNVVDIASTPIGEARFAADWVGNDSNRNAAPHETIDGFSGTLIGEFYGPAADELGGVLSGRRAATDAAPEQYLIGGFGGSQPSLE
ncbi:MAG: transferrin-binding protein-like solute binding protein, partial [Candidatus Tectomicrobia bacterium]|nr:transferrin-binding protein-like solute binding protein [Candidatus Tectomicrobia bacterium]